MVIKSLFYGVANVVIFLNETNGKTLIFNDVFPQYQGYMKKGLTCVAFRNTACDIFFSLRPSCSR